MNENKRFHLHFYYLAYYSPKKTLMSRITDTYRKLTMSAESRLLSDLGLENPEGVPTQEGRDLAFDIWYSENRVKVIEAAKKIQADEDKKK